MSERAKALKSKVPILNLDKTFYQLANSCQKEIDKIIDQLHELQNHKKYQIEINQPSKLTELQKVISTIDYLENHVVIALNRVNDDDIKITNLVDKICKEIHYPLLPPVASRISQRYYCIDTNFNHLRVPLLEADFLLHLPDLYHELGHCLINNYNNPSVSSYQKKFNEFLGIAYNHLSDRILEFRRNNGEEIANKIQVFLDSWYYWAVELFCDLFATFTIGSAYAWAHIYLCIKRGRDPYFIPHFVLSTHPADHARMIVILNALKFIVPQNDIDLIKKKWNEYLKITNVEFDANFQLAYPTKLLEQCVCLAFEGTKSINCMIASNENNNEVYYILNEAWKMFLSNSTNYFAWEKEQRVKLQII